MLQNVRKPAVSIAVAVPVAATTVVDSDDVKAAPPVAAAAVPEANPPVVAAAVLEVAPMPYASVEVQSG